MTHATPTPGRAIHLAAPHESVTMCERPRAGVQASRVRPMSRTSESTCVKCLTNLVLYHERMQRSAEYYLGRLRIRNRNDR